MIKCKDGHVKYRGKGRELLADYTTIGMKLRQILPGNLVDTAAELSKETLATMKAKIEEEENNG